MAEGTRCRRFYKTLTRKKEYQPEQIEQTKLRRCLGQWDVVAIGVGSTLGVSVSFIFGHVGLTMAGPSMVLSFVIGAVTALFAGLCFAEFGSRVPRAGGAYTYTYLALGELMAFIVGWNNLMRGFCSTASIARGLSVFMHGAFNISVSTWFIIVWPASITFMSEYFDFFAFIIVLIMGGVLVLGVRESMLVNNLFAVSSLVLVAFIVVVGSFAADVNNWFLPAESVPETAGDGGYFPFGVRSMVEGAGVCFYGFMSFDTICATGEEVKEPRRTIPMSILITLGITSACFTGVSVVVSMMMPYYMFDYMLVILDAFSYVNWEWARWISAIISVLALYASIFGSLYPLTRLVYAMSSDGLSVGFLSKVISSRHSPAFATILCTIFAALLAGFLAVHPLLQLVGLGTLLSYTAVAASVVVLRYKSDYSPGKPRYLRQVFGLGRSPTLASCRVVNVCLILFVFLAIMNALLAEYTRGLESFAWFLVSAVINGFELLLLLVMMIQPQVKEDIYFKTPLVPLVPCISMYLNIHIMVLNILDLYFWQILGIWLAIGIIIYLITKCCCHGPQKDSLQEDINLSQINANGKPPVQIIVESPTPPDTLTRVSNYGGDQLEDIIQEDIEHVRNELPVITEEITLHQASIENNEEKEAKIIDLLDQVLQAEEDTYGEVTSIKEHKEEEYVGTENAVQRKSLSELSDAGSDASLGNQALSKYDVIAQVHREDLPRVNEEEEKSAKEENINEEEIEDHEQVTAFNDSDSRTDESGYSDTLDRNALSESFEEPKEDIPVIPVPPPLDENFFKSPIFKSYTITSKHVNAEESKDVEDENRPRISIKSIISNASQNEDNIIFGSDRQIHFMSKLNTLFQNKITNEEEPRRRSHSTGNVVENTDYSVSRERTPLFLALKGEIVSKEAAQNLRPVNVDENENVAKEEVTTQPEDDEEASMSKDELKSKLENIFASGGPQLIKPRLMKSNPPTPEDSYQTDASSTESLPKLPKMEKNDTLKRQKDKFNEVLNSFRISFNADDV